jgi:hypothetical protein
MNEGNNIIISDADTNRDVYALLGAVHEQVYKKGLCAMYNNLFHEVVAKETYEEAVKELKKSLLRFGFTLCIS